MSTFSVPVFKLEKFGKHPNADTLSIVSVEGCPCIFRTNDFKAGDLVAYVPVESVVDVTDPRFEFLSDNPLAKTKRVKAKRLRGIFSMGLLIKAPEGLTEGQDAACALNVKKYEEPEDIKLHTESEIAPVFVLDYDIESYRKYKGVLIPNEEVVVTEKIHGCQSRFIYKNDRLWVASRSQFRKFNTDNLWWKIAIKYDLENKLKNYPNYILYGETYGHKVQDLQYGLNTQHFAAFDVYDLNSKRFLNYDEFVTFTDTLNIPRVPVLYRGPYVDEILIPMSNGTSTVANHMREGWVIKPTQERWDQNLGRVILKLVGEDYHLRKNGTEFH